MSMVPAKVRVNKKTAEKMVDQPFRGQRIH